jgi:hypothetical protein
MTPGVRLEILHHFRQPIGLDDAVPLQHVPRKWIQQRHHAPAGIARATGVPPAAAIGYLPPWCVVQLTSHVSHGKSPLAGGPFRMNTREFS